MEDHHTHMNTCPQHIPQPVGLISRGCGHIDCMHNAYKHTHNDMHSNPKPTTHTPTSGTGTLIAYKLMHTIQLLYTVNKSHTLTHTVMFKCVVKHTDAHTPHTHIPVCFPSQSCYLEQQKGSAQGLSDLLEWGIRLSNCPMSWTSLHLWHRILIHNNLLLCRRPHPGFGTSPGLLCPRSRGHTPHIHTSWSPWHPLGAHMSCLHCDQSVVHHHLLSEEVCSNGGLVLRGELLVHVLVH